MNNSDKNGENALADATDDKRSGICAIKSE